MIFKIIIILLAAAMLISLFSSAFFLVKDKGNTERAHNTLRIRVTIAVLIMITVAIGIYTGQLGVNIPLIEIHLSNIYGREEFREKSYFSDIALGVVSGFGKNSYLMAFQAAKNYLLRED